MSVFKRFGREVHRRSLWQVLGLYLAASWVVLQVVGEIAEGLALPEWVQPLAIVLLLVGFPVVLATAFVQEGIGGGRGRSTKAQPPPGPATGPPLSEPGADPGLAGSSAGPGLAGSSAGPGLAERGPAEPGVGVPAVPAGGVPPAALRRGVHHRILTWRNALVGGATAFALLGLATAGYLAMRSLGIGPAGTLVAKGVLEEKGRILLAEFQGEAGDSVLARAATEAFRVDFEQSPAVSVVQPAEVGEALQRMGREFDATLDAQTAREVAIREGVPAYIVGEVNPVGRGFVLSARLLLASDGQVLVSHRETASDSAGVIEAIDALSRRLRERIGESLGSIRGDPPLARVTTADLEALQLYSQGEHAVTAEGDYEKGISLLEEAVARDSAFAMAWRKLGVAHGNRGERAGEVEGLTRAFEHRDRLTRRERSLTTATYYADVTDEREKAITAYEALLELDPMDAAALNNLANVYWALGDVDRARDLFRRAIEADTLGTPPYRNLTILLTNVGEPGEAAAMLDLLDRRTPGNPGAAEYRAYLAAERGKWEEAASLLHALRESQLGSLFWRANASALLGSLAAVRGRLAEAEALYQEQATAAEARNRPGDYLTASLNAALVDLLVREDPERGLRRVATALERYPLTEIEPLDRPYLELARLYAWAGRPARARELLARYEAEIAPELRRSEEPELTAALGALALAEGRPEEAVARYRVWRRLQPICPLCGIPDLALTFDAAGEADSARAYYERYLETPTFFRLRFDQSLRGRSLERLGQLYDEAGDLENAARYYARFVELWREADPELQPRVEAAQARLEAIVAERG